MNEKYKEPVYFRCSNPQRSLKSIYVCLVKKCPETCCGFHRRTVLSDDSGSSIPDDPFLDNQRPLEPKGSGFRLSFRNKREIKASRKKDWG